MQSIFKKKVYEVNGVSITAKIILNFSFILFTLMCLFPVLLVLSVSLSSGKSILDYGYQLIPKEIDFTAYQFLFKQSEVIFRAYGVTIFVTMVGSVLSVLLMALYAYPISRKDFAFRHFFTFFIFITMLFDGGLVPKYLIYTRLFDIKDTVWALIIPMLVAPFNVLIMRTFFETSIPSSIIESAKIDGSGELRIFLSFVLPLSLPVLATIGLFSVVAYWNDWYLCLVYINKQELYPLQYLMINILRSIEFLKQNMSGLDSANMQLAKIPDESTRMAMAIIGMGPIVLAYPFFQKYFVKGLTVGAVKG